MELVGCRLHIFSFTRYYQVALLSVWIVYSPSPSTVCVAVCCLNACFCQTLKFAEFLCLKFLLVSHYVSDKLLIMVRFFLPLQPFLLTLHSTMWPVLCVLHFFPSCLFLLIIQWILISNHCILRPGINGKWDGPSLH